MMFFIFFFEWRNVHCQRWKVCTHVSLCCLLSLPPHITVVPSCRFFLSLFVLFLPFYLSPLPLLLALFSLPSSACCIARLLRLNEHDVNAAMAAACLTPVVLTYDDVEESAVQWWVIVIFVG